MAFCIQEVQAGANVMEPMDVDEGGGGEVLTEGRERQEGMGGYPPHWVRMSRDKPTVAVNLSMESEEFNTVLMFFLATFSRHGVDVQRIFRIQSTFLWKHYVLKGEEMKLDHAGKEVDQRLLFHGTRCSYVDGICRKGFDWRLSARTKYGHGCYFARKSSFSHGYSPRTEPRLDFPHAVQTALPPSSSSCPTRHTSSSASSNSPCSPLNPADPGTGGSLTLEGFQRQQQQCHQQGSENVLGLHQPWLSSVTPGSVPPWHPTAASLYPSPHLPPPPPAPSSLTSQQEAKCPGGLRYMFVARVLVGRRVRGNSSYRRPPAMLPGDPNGPSFDSCVDNEQDPAIFIIFDRNQAYPEYLVEYTCIKD